MIRGRLRWYVPLIALFILGALCACPASHRPLLAWDPMDEDTEGCWCGNVTNCGPGDLAPDECEE